ncbi:MAG: outer membrane beta-barrel protein [Sphingomicrobium sp.]
MMRTLLLAAVATATLVASPAAARDRQWYVGIEGGLLFPRDSNFDVTEREFLVDNLRDSYTINDFVEVDHKLGVDLDLIAGYDLGVVRLEAEFGYKRAGVKDITVNEPGEDPVTDDGDGHVTVKSVMGNLLFDFGNQNGWSFYAGPGIGVAWTKYSNIGLPAPQPEPVDYGHFNGKDHAVAWQLIAGTRLAISDNLDIGLKYRYFRTARLNLGQVASSDGSCETFVAAVVVPTCRFTFDAKTRFSSHSLLASLTYNFGAPPLPPPPPPPPPPPAPLPATQTCADGSVILASDTCLPPPPPPPPPPEPERG